jgi:hypothetical protein
MCLASVTRIRSTCSTTAWPAAGNAAGGRRRPRRRPRRRRRRARRVRGSATNTARQHRGNSAWNTARFTMWKRRAPRAFSLTSTRTWRRPKNPTRTWTSRIRRPTPQLGVSWDARRNSPPPPPPLGWRSTAPTAANPRPKSSRLSIRWRGACTAARWAMPTSTAMTTTGSGWNRLRRVLRMARNRRTTACGSTPIMTNTVTVHAKNTAQAVPRVSRATVALMRHTSAAFAAPSGSRRPSEWRVLTTASHSTTVTMDRLDRFSLIGTGSAT